MVLLGQPGCQKEPTNEGSVKQRRYSAEIPLKFHCWEQTFSENILKTKNSWIFIESSDILGQPDDILMKLFEKAYVTSSLVSPN